MQPFRLLTQAESLHRKVVCHNVSSGWQPGAFNTLSVAVFPLRLHLRVHYVLLDGQGHYEIDLGAAADADEHAQRGVRHEVDLRNPHHAHDGVVILDMLLSAPGLHWVRLYANDEMVAHRGFAVSQDAPRVHAKELLC